MIPSYEIKKRIKELTKEKTKIEQIIFKSKRDIENYNSLQAQIYINKLAYQAALNEESKAFYSEEDFYGQKICK